MTLPAALLHAAIRDAAARLGWADGPALISAATADLCRRHRIRDDAGREDISGRLAALWAATAPTEPN